MKKEYLAEFIGTFWLVFAGCGSAVLAADFPDLGIGFVGVSLAFGLSVLTMIHAIGHISGAHLNPAVTLGFYTAGKIHYSKVIPYIFSQIFGAIVGAGILYIIVTGNSNSIGTFAVNGYEEHSPGGYDIISAITIEFVLTFMFLIIILGSTDKSLSKSNAGIVIGLALTLIHLISIPVTNTSVNPARSISQALFVGDWAIAQLWLFTLIPIIGAVFAGYVYKFLKP